MPELILLKLEITNQCPFNCPYCFAPKETKKIPKKFFKVLPKLLSDAKKLGLQKIVITGGEPLTEKDVCFKILKLCKTLKIKSEIYTNGYLLTPKIIDQLNLLGCKNIRFTFLTTNNSLYTQLVGLNNKNLVNILKNNIIYAKRNQFKVSAGITPLIKSTLKYFPHTLNELINLKIDQIEISGLRTLDCSYPKDENLTNSDWKKAITIINKTKHQHKKPKIYFYRCEGHFLHLKKSEILTSHCGFDYLAINCLDGNIYPSTAFRKPLTNVFDKDFDFNKFWKNNNYLVNLRKIIALAKNKNVCYAHVVK